MNMKGVAKNQLQYIQTEIIINSLLKEKMKLATFDEELNY